jgi:hypothetical protein
MFPRVEPDFFPRLARRCVERVAIDLLDTSSG